MLVLELDRKEVAHMTDKKIRLSQMTTASGWAAKIGPGVLSEILNGLPKFSDPNLIVGFDKNDDASVYKISDQLAIVQTVDFFPPMVDDPYTFGQIAAANALSDVYAMGGKPSHCMNLLAYPECLAPDVVAQILQGGYNKVAEAGAIIAGGHTITDNEPKYGLSVTGFIDPKDVLTNSGAKSGDKLIISKPLGIGILTTAAQGDMLSDEQLVVVIEVMIKLNRRAAEIGQLYPINGCTDVTGYGLVGHALEMLGDKDVDLVINSADLPLIDNAYQMAEMGLIPAGAYANREFAEANVSYGKDVDPVLIDIICDPQTSGGLIFAVLADKADALLADLIQDGHQAACIGEFQAGSGKLIIK